ncbi:hypothetical protein B7494_g5289 [Chlorociboria aeruginascens]|nr:hypothetical protein B7494_g5289 [Chlorociboria aeruginascens]
MECASRATNFWTYQTGQEIVYQEHLAKNLTDKYATLNTQMNEIFRRLRNFDISNNGKANGKKGRTAGSTTAAALPPPPSYLSLDGFHTPLTKPERSNDAGAKLTHREDLVAGPTTSAGHNRRSQMEQSLISFFEARRRFDYLPYRMPESGFSKGGVRQNGRRGKPLQSWFLNIILFGRACLEEKVGEYLSNHKMYLQDPRGCETVMTSSFDSTLGNLETARLEARPNLLAQLMEDDISLPETEAPDIVKPKLFSHQKQALTFMLPREKGWELEAGRDIWSRQKHSLGSYINNVNGYSTDEAPLDFRGGLLADDMGLGKTLSMISLISANQANIPAALNSMVSAAVKATLLIMPPELIQTWAKQLDLAITISRTKAVVQLPSRIDKIHRLNFSPAEQEKYDTANTQSRVLLEEAISSGNQGGKTFNALWLLNILRLICNHGLLAQSTVESKISQTLRSMGGWSPGEASDSFYSNVLGGSANCLNCGANLLADLLEGSAKADFEPYRQTRPCGQMIYERCKSQTEDDRAGHSPWDLLVESGENSAPATPSADCDLAFTINDMSTKIKALVVFSYWANTLDLVQLMLNDRGISYCRTDGKTSLPKRNEALRAFQSNDSVRVILVSITCGGASLDLTAGSQVYLIEPHWNPMIEEQALCQVHRVGQTCDITTTRYLMRDSFEEQIVDIQKRKKKLAQVMSAEGPLSDAGISLGTLQYLKSVLG